MNNYTMMTDLYELTMAQEYFNDGEKDKIAYFDSFFRTIPFEGGYAIMGGVEDIIAYIKNLKFTEEDIAYLRSLHKFSEEFLEYLKNFKFTGDIFMVPDGTPIFANEPIMTVKANLIEAQIIETAVLSYLNSCILFTTAAKRMTDAAGNIPIMEFGARRANGPDAAFLASKCGIIGGCSGTSNVAVGKRYHVPIMGTMAHSYVEKFPTEYDAFLAYAKLYPNDCTLLIDTYDTIHSGILNAIRVAKEFLIPSGYHLKGVRIDSGDLAYLSKKCRQILDKEGLQDCKICLSNGLTAETIMDLKGQGAIIDSIGAGDNIAAPKERVGCVYKLVAIEENNQKIPKIKLSNTEEKIVNPGYKKVYRIYDKKTGYAKGDLVALQEEIIPKDKVLFIDPENHYNQTIFTDYEIRPLQETIFENGNLVYNDPSILEKQEYCKKEMDTLYEEVRRLCKPHKYYVDLTLKLLKLKKDLIKQYKEDIGQKIYHK